MDTHRKHVGYMPSAQLDNGQPFSMQRSHTMHTDLTKRMNDWREGLLSDAEILIDLIAAKSEIVITMHKRETTEADASFAGSVEP